MENILEMRKITKIFPGVVANDKIDFSLRYGEVHSLFGENGAGKSTLMSILSGLYHPSSGEIILEGKPVKINSPKVSISLGIGMVYQHFMLIPQLSVLENIMMGVRQRYEPFLDLKKTAEKIRELSAQYGMEIDPWAKVWQLSVGQQQRVEIIKALYRGARILVLDEPTGVLTPQETEELFRMIDTFTSENFSVVFISHKIREVIQVSDRITVLRQGKVVGTVNRNDADKQELARMMVGRPVNFTVIKGACTPGNAILRLQDVSADNARGLPALKKVSFDLHCGEILGVAGVDGNGQSELVEVITGLRGVTSGTVLIKGNDMGNRPPREIMEHNVGHIPEDRRIRGLVLDMDVKENMILHDYYIAPHTRGRFLNWKFIGAHAEELIREYDVRTPGASTNARNLSGGNQQKLILARELHRSPELLIAMHSTRGLDVGAIEYVHKRMIEQRDAGTAILYVSTEIEEILNLSDRILVLYRGEVMGIVDPAEISLEALGLMMAGAH
jgi:general nucleoside transport system ATP-binding protein